MRSARSRPDDEARGRRGGVSPALPAPDVESSSDDYARRFAGAIGAWFLERQAKGVISLLEPLGPCRVLEVGGGHAQLTAALVDAGHTVTVQGSDESCAARVRRLFTKDRVPFVACPLDRLPFEPGSFDAIVTTRMMAHVDDPARFLAECARVARRAVLVDYPSRRSVNCFADLLFTWKRGVEHDTRVYRTFVDREVRDAFAAHGLHAAGAVRQFFWPMALHRAHTHPRVGDALELPARVLLWTRAFGSPVLALYRR